MTEGSPDSARSSGATVTSRRQLVAAVGNAGLAVGAARLSPIDALLAQEDERTTITYGYARSDHGDPASLERQRKTVPGDWYQAVTRAFDMHRQLIGMDLPGLLGSAVVPGTYDAPMASITVDVLPDAETVIRERLSDLLDSIEFAVTLVHDPGDPGETQVPEDIEYASGIEGPGIPGGVLCGNDSGMATLAPALVDPETESTFFATSNHLYGGDGDEHQGEPLYVLPEEGQRIEIGHYVRGYAKQDILRARPAEKYEPLQRIEGTTPGRVNGQFTRIGLADLHARDVPLHKVGARTGHTTGKIRGIDAVTCYSSDGCRRGQLRWGSEQAFSDGDSGSVSVAPDPHQSDEYVMVAGLNNARTWWPGQSFIWGTAAYHLTDVHGYHF